MKFHEVLLNLLYKSSAMFYDEEEIEEERMRVIEYSRKHCKGSKEEIELYEQISLALELMRDDSFEILGSQICNGIDFHIVTDYPNGLPINVGTMFFNINHSYDVNVKETPLYTNGIGRDPGQTNFAIKITKHQDCFCNYNDSSYTCICFK